MKELDREMFNRNLAVWLSEQECLLENELTLLNIMRSIKEDNVLSENQFDDLSKVVIEYLRLIGIIREYAEEFEELLKSLIILSFVFIIM